LGTFSGAPLGSSASAINDSGVIVGNSTTASGASHATKWNGTVPTDLGTLGGTTSSGAGINSAGFVVGSSSTAGDVATHATLWKGRAKHDLGTLGGSNSSAAAINACDEVVGSADTTSGAQHPALWTPAGIAFDLNTLISNPAALPYPLIEATAISKHGWIVANAMIPSTAFHGAERSQAYLLIPNAESRDHGDHDHDHGCRDHDHEGHDFDDHEH